MISRGKFRQERGSTSELVIQRLIKVATQANTSSEVNNLYLNSLLLSMVNRVSRSGTMKYQCENADESYIIMKRRQTGPGHMTNHEILLIKFFGQLFCISTYLDGDLPEHYSANAQNTYRRIYKYY